MSLTTAQKALKQAGGASTVARALGLTPQAVGAWGRRDFIPHNRVLDVERLAKARVGDEALTRHDLRPDLYPREEAPRVTPPPVL